MDNNVLTSYDRMVIGKYFKNFNKECKLMGNLEGWGYVQMPVEHIYADLYLLITTEGGQTISLLYYNLYIINITNNLAHMYRGGYMCTTNINHQHNLSCYSRGNYDLNSHNINHHHYLSCYRMGYDGLNTCG